MSGGEGLRSRSELFQRVVSGLVLAIVALATAWWGGWPFALVWAVLAVAVAYEWGRIVAAPAAGSLAAATLVAAGGVVFVALRGAPALKEFLPGGLAAIAFIALMSRRRTGASAAAYGWLALGLIYAFGLCASVVILRSGTGLMGFFAILFLFIVVWLTDIAAYFVGRKFGGPKFAPKISPKKTWSGVAGGIVAGVLCGLFIVWLASAYVATPLHPAHVVIAFLLSVAVVYGDLFESFLKRRFGVKDAGSIIPGHGGFLDRLDGFAAAAVLAALIGLWRGGFADAAGGLLRW